MTSSTASRPWGVDAMFRLTIKELARQEAAAPQHGDGRAPRRRLPRRHPHPDRHRRPRPSTTSSPTPTPAPTPTSGASARSSLALRRAAAPHRRRRWSTRCDRSTASTEVGGQGQRLRPDRRQARRSRSATPPRSPLLGANWVTVDELNPYQLADGPCARGRRRDRHRQALGRHRRLPRRATGRRCSPPVRPATFTIAGIAKFGGADSAGGATLGALHRRHRPGAAGRARSGRRRRVHRRARRLAARRWPRTSKPSPATDVAGHHRRTSSSPRTRRRCTRTSRRSASSCWSSPASRCSSVRSSSTTPSRSRWRSAPRRWRCCGRSAPVAVR